VAWALSTWYREPCAANCAAVSADTSSAAAGTTPVVGAAAAIFAAATADPMLCRSPAADASISGAVVTNDTYFPLTQAGPQRPGRGYRGARIRLCIYVPTVHLIVRLHTKWTVVKLITGYLVSWTARYVHTPGIAAGEQTVDQPMTPTHAGQTGRHMVERLMAPWHARPMMWW
jgi:hypothetical protein